MSVVNFIKLWKKIALEIEIGRRSTVCTNIHFIQYSTFTPIKSKTHGCFRLIIASMLANACNIVLSIVSDENFSEVLT